MVGQLPERNGPAWQSFPSWAALRELHDCTREQVLPGTDGETTTQGLDNLPARVSEYYKQVGAEACPTRTLANGLERITVLVCAHAGS